LAKFESNLRSPQNHDRTLHKAQEFLLLHQKRVFQQNPFHTGQ
jgi:hypothetical protein